MTKKAYFIIKELYIVSVLHFKIYGSLLPVLLAENGGMVMYYRSIWNHISRENYVYTKLFNNGKKIKYQGFKQS